MGYIILMRIGRALKAVGMVLCLALLADTRQESKSGFDDLIDAELQKNGLKAAPPCDDAEFLRRIALDLAGSIPSPEEVIAFLEDSDPKKRAKKIDALLGGVGFSSHWAQIWTNFLLGNSSAESDEGKAWFHEYLVECFSKNVPYDRMVRDMLAAEGFVDEKKAGFYVWRWEDAAELTGAAVRHFLGVQIRCAQCHDHPFDNWKQKDFWAMAAFFARTTKEYSDEKVPEPTYGYEINRFVLGEAEEGEIDLAESKHPMKESPRFLGENVARDSANRRRMLADWMISPKNRWFARATVNRVWGILLGRGFVHPVDNFMEKKPPSNAAALQWLADEFVRLKFDVRALVRTIANSRAYQRSSAWSGKRPDPKHFAVAQRRKLSRYQLFHSVAQATDFNFKFKIIPEDSNEENNPDMGKEPQEEDYKDQYFYQIQKAQSPVEKTLFQMNGSLVQDAISSGKRMAQLFELETNKERLDRLFLAALSRRPTAKESAVFQEYLGSAEDEYQAYEDLFWTVLNSSEFSVNR